MQIAQRLYEDGVITYMRTDGIDMAPEAIAAARSAIEKEFGSAYLPPTPRIYQNKAKNAQEAHEAIRPTDMFRHPDTLGDAGPEEALRPDLAAHPGEPDAPGRDRAHDRRHRGERAGSRRHAARRRLGRDLPGLPRGLWRCGQGRSRRRRGRRGQPRAAAARRGRHAETRRSADRAAFHPAAARATPKPASSRRWKSSASAGRRPTPRRSRCCRTATMCGSKSARWFPRIADGSSPRSSRTSSRSSSSTALPPALKRSSTRSPPVSSRWKDVLRDFWDDFTRQTDEIKDLRVSEVLDALNELARPTTSSRPRPTAPIRAAAPIAAPASCR